MKTVELIHPAHSNSMEDRLDPPLGLLLIASHLRSIDPSLNIRINDLSGTKKLKIGEADYYGITSYCPTMNYTQKLIDMIHLQYPKARVVVGGANPSALPFSYAKSDYVVMGNGEYAMADIVMGEPVLKYSRDKREVHAEAFPAFDLVDLNSYHRTIDGIKSAPLLTTRGCPFKCAFCGLSRMHSLSRIAIASPEQVYTNVKRLVVDYGIKAINFQDDIFTIDKRRLFKMLDMISSLGIVFRCHGRAGVDDIIVYKHLAEAGCKQISWGIESGSATMLERMNKAATVKDNYNVINWAKSYGITTRAFFVIGFPGETAETMEETRSFIETADPDQYFVSNFVPYPGTPVWNDPYRYGITHMEKDFKEYYQVGENGTGGLTIDTEWLSREEFRKLELELRTWLKEHKPRRGKLLDYEKRMEGEGVQT